MVGNLKNYTKIDVLRALLRIDKPVSRFELSKILDLGEGTIRSILDILKENGFLDSDKNGHFLSGKGINLTKKIKDGIAIKEVELSNIFPKQKKIAVKVRHPKNIDKAYILRDIAVKNGADGAIIIRYCEEKKLKISDFEYEEDFSEIENKFNLNVGDAVVVTYADSYRLAEHGALAVAVELNEDLKNLMEGF